MKIVVLDKCTVTNGDVDLSSIEKFGQVEYYDILPKDEIIRVLQGADAVICNKAVIDREIIDKTRLKFIGLFATGYNIIDIDYAKEKGIPVCNVPGYSTDSVAQLTISLLLELAGKTSKYSAMVADGGWMKNGKVEYFKYPITEISGKTIGIYGLGAIGSAVAKIALALGMRVIACSRTPKDMEGVEFVTENELFERSDFLSIHCPLTDETASRVNERTLALMKPTAFIINTARGGVIDEEALAEALNSGRIAGAALDVLTAEPMAEDCPLRNARNCIITPHIGWGSLDARNRLISMVCNNLQAFISGEPINVVNG